MAPDKIKLTYETTKSQEGVLTELPVKLARFAEFDRIALIGAPSSLKATLWFRQGLKRIFHIRIIRKSGRCIVEFGGQDPKQVLQMISVCRDHFDRWFGIKASDIQALDQKREGK